MILFDGSLMICVEKVSKLICRLCLGATIYHLWRQRNDLFHGNMPRSEEAIIVQIRWEVRSRLLVKCPTKKLAKNLDLVHRWNLQPSLHL